MSIRNKLLEQIVIASGGTVRNPNNRNMLLEDWLDAASGVPIPVNALLYWAYFQTDEGQAILEQVNKQTSTLTVRPTESNQIQSSTGEIITFGVGEAAFDRGVGMAIEGEADNIVFHSLSLQESSWVKRGASSATTSTDPAPDADYFMDNVSVGAPGVDDIFYGAGGQAALEFFETSLWIANPAGSTETLSIINSTGGSGAWDIDLSMISGKTRLHRGHPAVSEFSRFMTNASGEIGIQLFSSLATTQFQFWQADQIQGETLSSEIYTFGASATRAGSIPTNSLSELSLNTNFRIEFGHDSNKLLVDALTPNAVLCQSDTGNFSLKIDGTGSNLVASIGGTSASIAVSTPADIEHSSFDYVGGILYARAGGVRGVGVASATPVIGDNIIIGCDGIGGGYFEGTPKFPDCLIQEITS